MKKGTRCLLSLICILISVFATAQKPQFSKDRFQPVRITKLPFTPYTLSDFAKNGNAKSMNELITLPNKKKVTLEGYIKTINHIEKNLSEIGINRDRIDQVVVASKYNSVSGKTNDQSVKSKIAPLSKVALKERFKFTKAIVSERDEMIKDAKDKMEEALTPDADGLPNEPFNHENEFNLPEFKVADYGVKVKASYKQKGVLDPFSINGNQLQADSLVRMIKNTSNEFTISFNVNISTDLPAVGNFNIYKLESEFTAKSNKNQNHKSKARLQVLERLLLDENNNPTGDNYSYQQDAIYNTKQKLGSADIFTYGLNVLLPVDIYLNSTGVGAEFDMSIKRTGTQGTISPIITQSIIMETSASELLGIVPDLLSYDVADIGVGGEIRLIQGGFDFGGTAGLSISGGELRFNNDTYNAVTLQLLRGRLYTFYTYPKFVCDNIFFEGLKPSCWVQRRVENDFFETPAAIEFQQVLLNEFKGKKLRWK
jgi:hypothetical protein